jgi:hypothetical protein
VAEVSDNRQPLSKNQLGIAALVLVVLIGAGVGLYLGLKGSSGKHTNTNKIVAARIGPLSMSAVDLKAFARTVKTPFYWVGPRAGYKYEFTRATTGYLYLRYLPVGAANGNKDDKYTVITTYPYPDALNALKRGAKGSGFGGPGNRFIWVDPTDTNSVYVAFPGVNYEIEVYDPSAPIAAATAGSRKLKPVRG